MMPTLASFATHTFPAQSPRLEALGFKFSSGGAHISRTIMLAELHSVLEHIPIGSQAEDYRNAIGQQNILGKTTDSTRQKSIRHLRELYAIDEAVPVFGLLRALYAIDPSSLPILAIQVAWARDPLLRATTQPVLDAAPGEPVETASLARALEDAFPRQYSELNRDKIGRNAASSWTQSGHLIGRAGKTRQHVQPTVVALTLALFLGKACGFEGAAVFSNPWCQLLDLSADRARAMGGDAHRLGLINLRALGDVIELSFPRFSTFEECLR
jgi:hypothetical protein